MNKNWPDQGKSGAKGDKVVPSQADFPVFDGGNHPNVSEPIDFGLYP
jgi:hypothetical protein